MNLSNEKNALLNTVSRLAVDFLARRDAKFVTRGAMAAIALTVSGYAVINPTPAVAACAPASSGADGGAGITCGDNAAGNYDGNGFDDHVITVVSGVTSGGGTQGTASGSGAANGIDLKDGADDNVVIILEDLGGLLAGNGLVTATGNDAIEVVGDRNIIFNGGADQGGGADPTIGGGTIQSSGSGFQGGAVDITGNSNKLFNQSNGDADSGVIKSNDWYAVEINGLNNVVTNGNDAGTRSGTIIGDEAAVYLDNGTLGNENIFNNNAGKATGEDGVIANDYAIVNNGTNGTVEGTVRDGINAAGAAVLTVNNKGNIKGADDGIDMAGGGGVTVNLDGTGSTKGADDGIEVGDNNNLKVSGGQQVTGTDDGIHGGEGNTIVVTGQGTVVKGTNGDGIDVSNLNTISVTDKANVVGDPGIIVNDGNLIAIDGGAKVDATNNGIDVDDDNTVVIGAATDTPYAGVNGLSTKTTTGAGTVNVTGSGAGISLTDGYDGGTGESSNNLVIIGAGGLVKTASGTGIVVGNDGESNQNNSIVINDAGSIDAGGDGIVVNGQDDDATNNHVQINSGGVVKAAGNGVELRGDEYVTTGLGAVNGGGDSFFSDGDGVDNDLTNRGVINAGVTGVLVTNTNSDVDNQSGQIYAGADGVRFTTIHTDYVDGETGGFGETESGYQSDSNSLIVAGRDGIHYDNVSDDTYLANDPGLQVSTTNEDVNGLGKIDENYLLFKIKGDYPEVVKNNGVIEADRHGVRVNDNFAVILGEDSVVVAGGLPNPGGYANNGGDGVHADANNYIENNGVIAIGVGAEGNGNSHGIEVDGESNTIVNNGVIDTRGDVNLDEINNSTNKKGGDEVQDNGAGGDGIHAGEDGLSLGGLINNKYDQQEISNYGKIYAADDGIDVQSGYGAPGGEQIIFNGEDGEIHANDDGIVAGNYNIITNLGLISADEDKLGSGNGIEVGHSNVVDNFGVIKSGEDSGIVMGGEFGPFSFGNLVTNYGTIEAGEDGIRADGKGNTIFNLGGDITGEDNGVNLQGKLNDFTSSEGSITGGTGAGVNSKNSNSITLIDTTVSTTTGEGGDGIKLGSNNVVDVTDSDISGDDDGVAISGSGNTYDQDGGDITGKTGDGFAITGSNNKINVLGEDTNVSGEDDGIDITGASNNTIGVQADVSGNDDGIAITNGTSNVITVGGNVTGDANGEGGGDGVDINGGGSNTVSVTGAISGDPGVVITKSNSNNVSGASISGTNGGVVITDSLSNNVWTTSGSITGNNGDGVKITGGGSNIVTSASGIYGEDAVHIEGSDGNKVNASGPIEGYWDGVSIEGDSNKVATTSFIQGNNAEGVQIDGTGNIVKANGIYGDDAAVRIDGTNNNVNSTDLILSFEDSGVTIDGSNNVVTATSTISGEGGDGVNIQGSTNTVGAEGILGSDNGVVIGDGTSLVPAPGNTNTVTVGNLGIWGQSEDGVNIFGVGNNLTSGGAITGGEGGVVVEGINNTIVAFGDITGEGANGVEIGGNNNSVAAAEGADIDGAKSGVVIEGNSNHVSAQDMTGTDLAGVSVQGNNNIIEADENIGGGSSGVYLEGDQNEVSAGSVSSAGTGSGPAYFGIGIKGDQNTVDVDGDVTATKGVVGVGMTGNQNNVSVGGEITALGATSGVQIGININGDQNEVDANKVNAKTIGVLFKGDDNTVDIGTSIIAVQSHGVWFDEGTGNTIDLRGVTVTAGQDGVHVDEAGNTIRHDSSTIITAGDDGIEYEYGGIESAFESLVWAGTINAKDDGIVADSDYFSIVNNGTINADTDKTGGGDGIVVANNNTVDNNGTITGENGIVGGDNNKVTNDNLITATLDGINLGDNNKVYNNGTINAGDDGIDVGDDNYVENNSSLTINAKDDGIVVGNDNVVVNNGVINADTDNNNDGDGIHAGDDNKITNNGDISGWNGIVVGEGNEVVNDDLIEAENTGIYADYNNTVENTDNGSIVAQNTGVDLYYDNDLTNDGYIFGEGVGVNATYYNDIENNDQIRSYGDGVVAYYDNTITNNGVIDADDDGVVFTNSYNTLTNNDEIYGDDEGVQIAGSSNTVNNYGSIEGGDDGVDITSGTGNYIYNYGTITGEDDGIDIDTGGNVVYNYNDVFGLNGDGIEMSGNNSYVSNGEGAVIDGNNGDGVNLNGDSNDIDNYGTIVGSNDGVSLDGDSNELRNYGGSITGQNDDGVDIYGNGNSVYNTGSITGADEGIEITGTSNSIYNGEDASIIGNGGDGIDINGEGSSSYYVYNSVENDGLIRGLWQGIDNSGPSLYVDNRGAIVGTNSDGIRSYTTSGAGEDADWTSIDNYDGGSITGADDGIEAGGSELYVYNGEGAPITGLSGDGINTYADYNDIENHGTISGEDAGIRDHGDNSGSGFNETYVYNTGIITGNEAGYLYAGGSDNAAYVEIWNYGDINVTGAGVLPTPVADNKDTDEDESALPLDFVNGKGAAPVAAIDTRGGEDGDSFVVFNWGTINGANEFSVAVPDDPNKDGDQSVASKQLTNRFAVLGGEGAEYVANFNGGTINGDVYTQQGGDVLAMEIGSTLNGNVDLGQTLGTTGVLGFIPDDKDTKDVDESKGGTAVGFVATPNVDTDIDTVILFGTGYQDYNGNINEAEILYVDDRLTQNDILYYATGNAMVNAAVVPVLENQPTPEGTWSLNGIVKVDGVNSYEMVSIDGNANGILDEEADSKDSTVALINGTIGTVVNNGRLNIGATTITEVLGEPTDEEEGELEPSTFVVDNHSTAVLYSPVVDVLSGGTLGGHGTIITNPGANGGNGGVNLTGAVQGEDIVYAGINPDNIQAQALASEARGYRIIGTTPVDILDAKGDTVDLVTQDENGVITDKTKGDDVPDYNLVTVDEDGNLYPDIKLPAHFAEETFDGPFDFTTDKPRYATLAPGDEINRIGTLTVVGNVTFDGKETGTTEYVVNVVDDPATKDVDESKGGTAQTKQAGRTVVTNWGSQFQADLRDDGKGDLLLVKKAGVTNAFVGSTFDTTGPGTVDLVSQDDKGVNTNGDKGDGIPDFDIVNNEKVNRLVAGKGGPDKIADGIEYKQGTVLDGHVSLDGRLDIRLDGKFVDLVDNSQSPTITDPENTGCGDEPDGADSCQIPNPLYNIPDGIADVDKNGVAKNNADFSKNATVWDIIIAEGGTAAAPSVTGKFEEKGFDGGPNDGAVVTRYAGVIEDDPDTEEDESAVITEQRVQLLKAYLQYLPDRVRIISIPAFGPKGQTPNQVITGEYIDSLTKYGLNEDALHAAVALVGTASDIPAALDALHPEWYNAFNEVGFSIARGAEQQAYIRTIEAQGFSGGSQNRVVMNVGDDSAVGSSANDKRATFWLAGSWSNASVDSNEGYLEYKYDTLTGYAGFDYLLNPNLLLGVLGGFGNSDVDSKNDTKHGDVDSWQVGGYISYFTSSWFLNAGGGIGDMNIESIRNINFGSAIGSVSQVANAKYDGDITYFYGKGGYSFDLGNSGWKLSPELALSYVKVKQDGFSETGTGNAPVFLLNVDAQSVESLRGTAQLRLSKTFLAGNGGGWMPYARIGVANEFEDNLRPITAGFQGAPNTHFTVYGDVPRGTTAIFGLGVTGKVSESFSIYLDYSGEIGSDFSEHVISGGARFHF